MGTHSQIQDLLDENARLRAALKEICDHPPRVLNPDGKDQAAWEMQMIAADALDPQNLVPRQTKLKNSP